MSIDGVELLMDVYSPTSGDASPVVITFHGNSEAGKDDQAAIAEQAAAEGMVVFVPNWFAVSPVPVSAEKLQLFADVANCAVAFAQRHAADYGGDPAKTVVDGFSAGTYPVMWATLQPAEATIPGCETDATPTPAVGAVLGDGENLLQASVHDGAFTADPVGMQAEIAKLFDSTTWSNDMTTEFFVWSAVDGTGPRTIDDPADASGWLASRDGDGSIQADLERLGLLEDGEVTYSDTGQLLSLRLSEAGVAVTLDEYPGGHYTDDKLSDIVAYFATATGQ